MMSKKVINIYVLIVFMIGVSNPIGALITTNSDWNPFEALSPLPILFSIGKHRKSKDTKLKFILKSAHDEQKFEFDRHFYKNLGGPHRYKVMFTLKLNWTDFSKKASASNFIQETFCENYTPIGNLKDQKIESIQVLTRKNKVVLDWTCKS